jgi:hypothetical protein
MLDNKRQNYHHSKLPELGTIVTLPNLSNHGYTGKWIVESFNLCDNVLPYSVGIHLVNVRSLRDRNVLATVSGFYCQEVL